MTFYGVRGSCPCPSDANRRYGGNTACVALTVEGEQPIVFDLGTGLRAFGDTQPVDGSFAGAALVTHIHWDHVQGLPFFPPADRVGATFRIYGPQQDEGSLAEQFDGFMRPPYFPVTCSELRGDITFHEVLEEDFKIGQALVAARPVPHAGPTLGYRVTWQDRVVTYISDHQAPLDLDSVAESVLELAASADVLIHDAQYTRDEFAEKSHWGHCTIDYAVRVARQAGVRTLVLFHHDPSHGDDRMDQLLEQARSAAGPGGPEVVAAYEGLRLSL
ncbi:MAG TPA: MBL fold metallo-hydrolase [Acidimicrobiales bacterium]|nr:MBL fold metallo-hydrolase [Acidimicrobiales bacterium]